MPTQEQVMESLERVLVPSVMRNVAQMKLIRGVNISDHKVDVMLASAALDAGVQDWIRAKAHEVIKELPGVQETKIDFVDARPAELNEVEHVIAVMSGKGGVGKSLVAAFLAVGIARQGMEAGILDADITGPSIPKMFGLSARPAGSESGILPVPSRSGIEIMSINLLLPHEDDAVIWRGPLIGNAIKQFWEEVLWGKLDCLLIDLPPGTADAPLTVMQSLPVSGVVIVFSPQELAAMVVRKAIKMAEMMDIPILGVVENMSYLLLPDTGKKLEIFGRSRGEEMATVASAPLLGQIPIDPELARLCDEGRIENYGTEAFDVLARNFAEVLPLVAKKR